MAPTRQGANQAAVVLESLTNARPNEGHRSRVGSLSYHRLQGIARALRYQRCYARASFGAGEGTELQPEPHRSGPGHRANALDRPVGPQPRPLLLRRTRQGTLRRIAQQRVQPDHFVIGRRSGDRTAVNRAPAGPRRGRASRCIRGFAFKCLSECRQEKGALRPGGTGRSQD